MARSARGAESNEMTIQLSGPVNDNKKAHLGELFQLVEAAFDAWAIEKIESADHVSFRFSFPKGSDQTHHTPVDPRLRAAYSLAVSTMV
jgi:hypothetical protein